MDDITKKTIERIKKESIIPEAKIFSILRKYMLWFMVVLVVLFGSFAFSIIFYVLSNSDLDLIFKISNGYIFKAMPVFWIISFGLFIALGEYTYKNTAFGYRYGVVKIATIFLASTIILGTIFSFVGLPKYFQMSVKGNAFMNNTMSNQVDIWSRPKDGFLSGEIISVENYTINIKDFNGNLWKVDTKSSIVRGRVSLIAGEQVKILGKISGDSYIANDIRPWIGGMGQGRNILR